jgi:O-acetyl-ADP-ribose deacetylase (regulator of RNase III)
MEIQVTLCDKKDSVVSAWDRRFEKSPEVRIVTGDIFSCGSDAVVLPGNSYGFLVRGLELQASELFGFELQDLIRKKIRERYNGELLVGQGLAIPCEGLGNKEPPCTHLIYVSASRTPRSVDGTLNAYLAARGAFLALAEPEAEGINSVALPGIGTGESGMPEEICARQMRYAYSIFSGRRGYGDKNLTRLTRREDKLRRMPKPPREDSAAPSSQDGN